MRRLRVIDAMAFVAALVIGCTAAPAPATPSAPLATPTDRPAPTNTLAATASAGVSATASAAPLAATPTAAAFASSASLSMRPLGSVPGAPSGYAEYLPPGYEDGAPRPLLVFLHGSDENGDGSETALPRLARTAVPRLIQTDQWPAERPFVVLMPQHDGTTGSLCAGANEIDEFLAFAVEQYVVDRERVYLTGTSCGAVAAWGYLGQYTDDTVAAAVLIAGDGREAVEEGGCEVGRVAIWAFHGGADDLVSSVGSVEPITALRACTDPPPTDLELTVFDGVGHAIWNPIYGGSLGHDVFAWLLDHASSR